MTACPRCGEGVAAGQEYCLECGLRLPGAARLEPSTDPRSLVVPLLLAGGVAVGGAAAAIALTRGSPTGRPILTATGGSEPIPATTATASTTATGSTAPADWPAGQSGWTNVLVSIPKVTGRDAALASAERARQQGLRAVGVLDSSRHASLHPGYWVVFAGVYPSEPEAASHLIEASGVEHGARTALVSP